MNKIRKTSTRSAGESITDPVCQVRPEAGRQMADPQATSPFHGRFPRSQGSRPGCESRRPENENAPYLRGSWMDCQGVERQSFSCQKSIAASFSAAACPKKPLETGGEMLDGDLGAFMKACQSSSVQSDTSIPGALPSGAGRFPELNDRTRPGGTATRSLTRSPLARNTQPIPDPILPLPRPASRPCHPRRPILRSRWPEP